LLGGLGEFSLPRRVEECHEGVAEVAAGDDWWDSPNDLLDNQTPTAVLDDAADIDPTANSLEGTIETPSLRSPWDGLETAVKRSLWSRTCWLRSRLLRVRLSPTKR
jgi:hypothetical protein